MLVMNWMSQPAITVDIDDSVEDALQLIKKHEIHLLPVMQDRQLVGIVTDHDIKTALASEIPLPKNGEDRPSFSGIEVKKIMTPDPITITDECIFEEAVEKLLVHKISGLVVVNQQHEVVGVITQSDLFQLILILTGFGKKGLQIGIELEDQPGCLKEMTDIIRDYGGRISSILSTHERAGKGNRRLYIRVFDIDPPSLQHLKGVIIKKASLLYIVDYNGKTRETFSAAFDHNVSQRPAQFSKKGVSAHEC
jgi:acetoin utilization protein AcuB